ncbi:uncharacterized protein PHACADRAFT_129960 [Phanerochaete carnosa HHB-10118-sp]|uniref:Phosphatidic acid phosphatase type 2/haloperoxidase domain-containing protein n=1 Tax=Phanerochaete carnosa (strain HHB-10118-sp) TaxID=650164 RepID=K5VVK7_PHACS|nr:uncharacterized protein PHACADRAFT_129960 [Phanerochaete carnosa HHB-10118-sp]EKM50614.1 hypothetical protein PHACADRAFT_129960 [Phanerochaete carnosa HHB-10118-sp]
MLALLTLSPILLNPAYLALAVYTRELLFIEMWAGQLLCEAFNWVLKHVIREERPYKHMGPGYGFPSSHSQWMGYFAAFLLCHLMYRHRFVPTGSLLLDNIRNLVVYLGIIAWTAAVAFSRYALTYHSTRQVLWGVGIGVVFGTVFYLVVEVVPATRPKSLPGRFRNAVLSNPVLTWFRLRDGWAVYPDGGTETQWLTWKARWDATQRTATSSVGKKEKRR